MYHYKRRGCHYKEMICFCEDEELVSRDSSAPRKVLFWDSRSRCSPIHGKCRKYKESGMEVTFKAEFHYTNEEAQREHMFTGTEESLTGWDYKGNRVVLELEVGNQTFVSDAELVEFMYRLGDEILRRECFLDRLGHHPEGVCFLDEMD